MNGISPPPVPNELRSADTDQLRLLAILHYVFGGLSVLGLCFIGLHYLIMSTVLGNPKMWENSKEPPPAEFFAIFKWVYLFFAFLFLCSLIANILSASFIRARKHRMFSMVVAGLDCMAMPLGTALGIFTFVVLGRPAVLAAYEQRRRKEGLVANGSTQS